MRSTWITISLFAAAGLYLVLGLDWGVPSRARNELLTYGCPLTKTEFVALDSLTTDYFTVLDSVDLLAAQALQSRSAPIAHRATEVGAVLDRAEKLRGIRRFLLGSSAVDERKPFVALARMAPARGDLDPRGFMYGGAHIYPLGVALKAAELLGLTTLTADPEHALDHPREVAVLYIVGRALSAAAFLGVGFLLLRLCRVLHAPHAGVPALLAWFCSGVALNQALVTKPHALAACCALWSLYHLLRFRELGRRRSLVLAGAFAGLSAGCSFPAAYTWLLFPALLWRRFPTRSDVWTCALGIGSAVAAFLLSNPYLLLNPGPFFATTVFHGSPTGCGYAVAAWWKLVAALRETAMRGFGFPLSLIGLGMVVSTAIAGSGALGRLARAWLVLLVILGATVSTLRIILFLGPVLCLFTGLGLARLAGANHRRPLGAVVALILCIPALGLAGLTARDFLDDTRWHAPTLAWVRTAAISETTSIGIFDRPDPTNHPPFPFLCARLVNLLCVTDTGEPPDLVVLGDFATDRRLWAAHPLRPLYRLSRELGHASSSDAFLDFRMRSESRAVGWVYERIAFP